MKHLLFFPIFLSLLFPNEATAKRRKKQEEKLAIAEGRCRIDMLKPHQIGERNAWAFKCGYITEKDLIYFNSTNRYAMFDAVVKPTSGDECVSELNYALCNAEGCFAPDQRVQFKGEYIPIAKALNLTPESITTVASYVPEKAITFKENGIESFIRGDTKEKLFTFFASDGHRLQVTFNHPMVLSSGKIVEAGSVKEGDMLLTIYGAKKVERVRIEDYEGEVWNVRPKSDKTLDNIIVAEDFLTGSIRHQNEWLQEENRWFLRERHDETD